MSCLVQRNNKGDIIGVRATNGSPSRAFEAIYKNPFSGTIETALKAYMNLHSNKVKSMYDGVTDPLYVYEDSGEPRVVMQNSNNKIEGVTESTRVGSLGVINPKTGEFVKLLGFDTQSSVESRAVLDGINQGLISPERVITSDGSLRLSGAGVETFSKKGSATLFKQDFESSTGTRVKVFPDGTFNIETPSEFITLELTNGENLVLNKEEALTYLQNNNNVVNRDVVVYATLSGILAKEITLDKNTTVSEKVLMKSAMSFMNSLGFSAITMEEYRKAFKNRHGEDLEVVSLVDLANKIVAISEGQNVVDNVTEEMAHIAVEAYSDTNSIASALVEVESTPEYNEYASVYRNKYKEQYENQVDLEDAVRKEILGKVIANRIRSKTALNESALTIWQSFVNFLRNTFKNSNRTAIDRITNDVKQALGTQDLSKFSGTLSNKGVFYSITKNSETISKAVVETKKTLNSLADLAKSHGSLAVRPSRTTSIPDMMTDVDLVTHVTDIVDTVASNLKDLDRKISSGKVTIIDYIRVQAMKGIVDKMMPNFKKQTSEITTDSLQGSKEVLIQNIEKLTNVTNDISVKMETAYEGVFKDMLNDILDEHNLSEAEKERVKALVYGEIRDISRINSTWGMTSESSNPLLSILSKLINELKVETVSKSQKSVNSIIDIAEKNGFTDSKIQDGILEKDSKGRKTGFIETAVHQGRAAENFKNFEAEVVASLIGGKKEDIKKQLESKSYTDLLKSESDLQTYREKVSEWENENYVSYLTDESKQETEEINRVSGMSEATAEALKADKRTINEILSNQDYVRENGQIDRSLMTESDRIIFDEQTAKLKSKSSELDQNLDIRYGLELVRVSDLTEEQKQQLPYYGDKTKWAEFENTVLSNPNRVITLSTISKDDLPFESRYSLDIANRNLVLELKFRNNPKNTSASNMVNALRDLENAGDFKGALSLLEENGAIVFTDKFHEEISGNKSLLDVIEENREILEDSIDDLVNVFKDLTARKAKFDKSYRSSKDVTEINAQNIDTNGRNAFKKLEAEIKSIKRSIISQLKKQGIEIEDTTNNLNEEFTTTFNTAFVNEAKEKGVDMENKTGVIKFAIDQMDEHNANSTRDFLKYTSDSVKYGAPAIVNKRFEEFIEATTERLNLLEPYEAGTLSREEVMLIIQEQYALMRVPSYFRKSTPNSWESIKSLVEMGDIKLSDILENNKSLDKYLTIQPNYSWTDLSYNKGGVNPEYKKAYGGKQPKLSLYKNQEFFDKYGITEDEWLAAEDITEITARNNTKQFEYNKLMLTLRKESDSLYGYSGNIYKAIQQSTSMWQKAKSSTKAGGLRSGMKDMFSDLIADKVDVQEYGSVLDGTISGMEAIRIPPVFFRKNIEDQNSVTSDTLQAYLLDFVKANEYKSRVEMSHKFHALLHQSQKTNFVTNNIIKSKRKTIASGKSRTTDRIQEGLDSALYGVKQSQRLEFDFMGKTVDMTMVLDRFRKWSVFTNLGYNPLVAATSLATGIINTTIDKLTGGMYSKEALNDARKYITADAAKFVTEDGKLNPKSRLNAMMEFFGAKNVQDRFNESSSSRVGRLLTESGFKLDEYANLPIISGILYRVLFDHRVVEVEPGVKKLLSHDAFKTYAKTAGLKTKGEISAKWKASTPFFNLLDYKDGVVSASKEYLDIFSEEDFKKHSRLISSKFVQINQRVDGMLTEMDRTSAQRNALLNLIMQHKSWLPVSLAKQYKKQGFNFIQGRFEEGYARTTLTFLAGLIQNYRDPKNYIKGWIETAEDRQKKNLKRFMMTGTMMTALAMICLSFVGADDDDDSFAEDFARIISYRTMGEVVGDSMMGAYNTGTEVLKSPFTALSTFESQFKLLGKLASVGSESYSDDLYEQFMKSTVFNRITKLSDLGDYTTDWLQFNKGTTEFISEAYKNN